LADVDNTGENDALLTAMLNALQQMNNPPPEAGHLRDEIGFWLNARQSARKNEYNDALDKYRKAIQSNSEDNNPATHFERARILLGLPSPIYPDALSDLDAAIAAARKVSQEEPGGSTSNATPTPNEVAPTLTPPPTNTPLPKTVTAATNVKPTVTGGAPGTPAILPTLTATGSTPAPTLIAPGQPPGSPPPALLQRPFRSDFITFVQIASAVRRLIDSNQGLVAFLASSAESDYNNLRGANLVLTLTPTPGPTPTPSAQLVQFLGSWTNKDPNTQSIARTSIRTDAAKVFVHMWGACAPTDCDWGETTTDITDVDDGVLSLMWDQGFEVRTQQVSLLPDGVLRVVDHSHFTDNSGRADLDSTDDFIRESRVVVSPTVAATPIALPSSTVVPDAVADLFRRTNELRQNNKLSPYTLNADLNQVALAHSQDMANLDQLTDTGADGSTAVQRITNAGYGAGQPSEAICSGPGETLDGAWGKLTADSADLANLLNSVNTDIGIGVAQNTSNTYYTLVFGKPAQASKVPWGKSLAGVGMGNPQPLAPAELQAITDSKVEAVLVLSLGNPDENVQLVAQLQKIRPDMFIVARLFFSVDFTDKTRFSPQDFVNFVLLGAQALYDSGVRYFEVNWEPNLDVEGMGWNWANGAEYGQWFTGVVDLLRKRLPEAKFGFPALSPQPNVSAFLDGAASAIAQADWIGAASFWQSADQPPFPMTGDNGGMYWRQYRTRFPDKLIMITEFSNNSATVSSDEKARQYATYYQLLRNEPNLGAAFAFAINWPGQDNNHEGWVFNGKLTTLPSTLGQLIGEPGFLDGGVKQ
jgi:uncharacterized protein YkwD